MRSISNIAAGWDHICPSRDHDRSDPSIRETSMANGVVVEFAVFLMAAVVLTFVVVMFRRRTTPPELPAKVAQIGPVAERSQTMPPRPVPAAEASEAPPPV